MGKAWLAGAVLAVATLGGMTVAQAQSGAYGSGGTIKIGVSGPFTGGSAPMGESMRNGIRLAVSEINSVGGLMGRQIELVERDDQADNATGGRIAEELAGNANIVAGIGIVNTGVAMASIDAWQKAKKPMMIAVSTGPVLTSKFAPPNAPDNYIFRVSFTLNLDARMQVEDLKRRQVSRVAVMADTTAYGEAGLNAFREAATRAGLEIVSVERFKVGEQDMSVQVRNARAQRPQSLVLWGIGPELAAIATEARSQGLSVPLVGSWTFSMKNFIDPAGRAAEGALMPQTFIQESGSAAKNSFLLAYYKLFKDPIIPSPMSAAQGYDGMYLLAAAIRQAGDTDGPKVRAALESLKRKVTGVITTYDKPYNREDHDAITSNMVVMGKVHNGRVEYAYAEDAKRGLMARKKEKN